MHNLMEVLRPVWENPESDAAKKICDEGITLTLFDESGAQVTGITLDTAENAPVQNSAPVTEISFEEKLKAVGIKLPPPEGELINATDYLNDLGVPLNYRQILSTINFGSNRLAVNQWTTLAITLINYNEKINDVKNIPAPKVESAPVKKLVDLKKILRDRIEKGVRNFFYSMKQAFESDAAQRNFIKQIGEVKEFAIFLAGNSSKSELVKEIFEEYIGEKFKVGEILGIEKNSLEFKIYPPLGTAEAMEIQKSRGIKISNDPLELMKQPTGKTGVAFGLLRCRESGRIEVSDIQPDEITGEAFQFYIGRHKKGKFKTLIDRNTKMFVWKEFLDDASASFDILYTDVPEAATNNAPITISKQYPVRLEQTNSEAQIYIRPVAPYSIEYAIAYSPEDLAAENYVVAPVRINLK